MLKWYAKHSKAIFRIFIVLYLILLIPVKQFDLSIPIYIISFFAICFIFLVISVFCQTKLYTKAVNILENECDPTPLFEISSIYFKKNEFDPSNIINYSVALENFDSKCHKKSKEILENADVSKWYGKTNYLKCIYYNNLCSAHIFDKEIEKAEEFLNLSREFLEKLQNPKEKAHATKALSHTYIDFLVEKGEYEKALELLNKNDNQSKRGKVNDSMTLAKIHIAKNEKEEAKEQLLWIIENGNKLSTVDIAKEMLEKL